MDFLDQMFGSCMRSMAWGSADNNRDKYIDYLPSKKWKYKDENLMYELSDKQSWDVMDLSGDDVNENKVPHNVKLRLHDNVFMNPLNISDKEDETDVTVAAENDNDDVRRNDQPNVENEDLTNNLECSHEEVHENLYTTNETTDPRDAGEQTIKSGDQMVDQETTTSEPKVEHSSKKIETPEILDTSAVVGSSSRLKEDENTSSVITEYQTDFNLPLTQNISE